MMNKTAKSGISATWQEAVGTFVVVTVGGDEVSQTLQSIAAQTQPRVQFRVVDNLTEGLNLAKEAPVLVLHMSPEAYVLRALRGGASMADALTRWRAVAEAYLNQARKVRRQIISFDSETFVAQPDRCAELLAGRMGFHLEKAVDSCPKDPEEKLSAVWALAAHALIRSDSRALALADELEAMNATPVALAQAENRNLERVFVGLRKLETELEAVENLRAQKEGTDAQTAVLKAERDQLRAGLEQIQHRLEREVHASHQQAAASKGLRVKLLELEAKHQATALACARGEEASARIAVMEAERDQLQVRLEHMQADLQRAHEDLAIVYRSNSWRVTGPLRWLRQNLAGG